MIDPLLCRVLFRRFSAHFSNGPRVHGFSISGGLGDGAFAFPLMVFAEDGLVFLKLAFEFGEGLFAAAAGIFGGARSMQRSGGQRQIH